MRGIAGTHVVVAGGASGMGLATVERLLEEDARVSILDRDVSHVADIGSNDIVAGHAVDIVHPDAIASALDAAIEWGGPIHAAINTAGIGFSATIADQTIDQFRRVYEVNVFGMYNLVKAEAERLGGGGAIVNFVSTNSRQPAAAFSAYASSKAAVENLTAVAAIEFAERGIRVCGISPALTATPMVKRFVENPDVLEAYTANILIGRPADPSEVAAVAVFLISDDAAYLTGQTIPVDGGSLLLRYPTLAERTQRPASPAV